MAAPEDYLGSISFWGPNFAPVGYAFCNGQLLSISQNEALFSLLGTILFDITCLIFSLKI